VCTEQRTLVDERLRAFAQAQRRAGRRVLGLVMAHRRRDGHGHSEMVLGDVDTGQEYLVSQPMGAGSDACCADPQGFAQASRVLRDAAQRRADLVVCNRFGALEAQNGGFVAELLALLEQGTPVLTVVAPRHLAAWQRFAGDAVALSDDPSSWAAWIDSVLRQRARG
jgi:nucleoside-triphosphatase THEP1